MVILTLMMLSAAPAPAGNAEGLPSPGRPYGALLGASSLVFTGWPSLHQGDGPCGHPAGTWHVEKVVRGDQGLVGKDVPIYGSLPLNHEARTMMIFLRGKEECPELVAQQEIGVDTILRAAAQPEDCTLQVRAVDQVLRGLATDCDRDADCAAPPLHPNSCERPRPYSARAQSSLPAFWGPLARRARGACEQEWSKRAACAPVIVPVHCHEHRCLEGPSPAQAPPFARGTLGEGCAPTDAPATDLLVQPLGIAYPRVGINWWGEGRPHRGAAGSFSLDGAAGSAAGFNATFCPFEGGCSPLHAVRLRLQLGADGKGKLELDAETAKGEKVHAAVPAEFGPARHTMCG